MVEFDPAKEEINLSKHGISLARWVDLDIKVAFVDHRYDYGGSAISLMVLLTVPLIAWPLRTAVDRCGQSAFDARTQRR